MNITYIEGKDLPDKMREEKHFLDSVIIDSYLKPHILASTADDDVVTIGKSWVITKWNDETMLKTKEIVIYNKGNEIIAWEPTIEKLLREAFIKETEKQGAKIVDLKQGYINGLSHYRGNIGGGVSQGTQPGYTFYVELKIVKDERI